MFDFILSYSNFIKVVTKKDKKIFRNRFFELFMQELEQSYITDIEKKDTEINFTAPIGRFTWNGWNFLNPITSGKIRIVLKGRYPRITYKIVFSEFFFIALALSLVSVTAFGLDMIVGGVFLIIFFFFGFYGISRSIAIIRMENYIKETVFKVNNPEYVKYTQKEYVSDDIGFFQKIWRAVKEYRQTKRRSKIFSNSETYETTL